jgi:hypothetical protein
MKDQKDTGASTFVLEDTLGETQKPARADLQKWKKAVIHLECRTHSESDKEHTERVAELRERLKKGEITRQQLAEGESTGVRDVRSWGTAIFLEDNSRRYLVTARHVLYDEAAAEDWIRKQTRRLEDSPSRFKEKAIAREIAWAKRSIVGIIFQVPSHDSFLKGDMQKSPENLMNLGAGVVHPYTFADEVDLAIISLDQRDSAFAAMLFSRGYRPIRLSDIAEQPSSEGASVFSVGYPGPMSTLGEIKNLHPALKPWASSRYSLPTFVFGRVAMLHNSLPDFRCDFTNYQGNSGGPVVEKNRMVGVVWGQPFYEVSVLQGSMGKTTDFFSKIGVPFAIAVKAAYVKELLKKQIEKDQGIRISFSRRSAHRSV